MSPVTETSLSLLASALPVTTTSAKIMDVVLFLVITAFILHYASPAHLTRVLLAAMHDAESAYFDALEAGIITASHAEQLSAPSLRNPYQDLEGEPAT
ncbi:hypothetical protein C8R43DRAFT_1238602 [Mycena crocata]|nr:hypothetical protein C8R43DRAFT_1238602 [Mycena crocata]